MVILPFLAMCFMALKGFVYTIGVDVYAFYLAFWGKSHHIQQHFTLHLAPKRTAFSGKTHCIQRQNALRLAPKRTAFSSKQPENGCKWRAFQINIHFANIHMLPLFVSKQTFARIDYLRQGVRLVGRMGSYNVKFSTKNWTKTIVPRTRAWATGRKARTLTTASARGYRACSQRPTATASWKGKSNLSQRKIKKRGCA